MLAQQIPVNLIAHMQIESGRHRHHHHKIAEKFYGLLSGQSLMLPISVQLGS